MTGSGNFPPGRALRPEVRMNKEQEEAVMKRLTVEEIGKLSREYEADPEGYRMQVHSAHALLAMASRLVEVESVMRYLYREGSRYPRSADELLSFGASLGWTSPTQKPNDGGRDG